MAFEISTATQLSGTVDAARIPARSGTTNGFLTPSQIATVTHTHTAAQVSDFTEASQDVVGAMVAAAGGSYNDTAGTITLPTGSGGGGATTSAQIADFTEASQDVIGAMVTAAGGSYNDAAGTIVIPRSKPTDAISVRDYGAVGDGATDDRLAIQNAINAAASQGADVLFDARRYVINGTLHIGNGSASAVSPYGGVRLIGAGQPLMPPQFMAGYPVGNARGTRLIWNGTTGGTMLSVNGPLQGWGVHNIFFDGVGTEDFAGRAGRGIYCISAMNGDCRNLTFRGCREASIYSTTHSPPSGVLVTDSLHNSYQNINIATGWAPGVKGIVLTGVSPAGPNTCFNQFSNVAITLPTTLESNSSAYGLYLQSCDSNVFQNFHFFNGNSNCAALVFDYTINPDWPCGNQFYGMDWGGLAGPIQVAGTPTFPGRPNFLYSVSDANGGFMPAGVPNVVTEGNVVASLDRRSVSGPIASTVILRTLRTGLYRLNYNLLVTGGGANGGNLTLTMSWLDGSGTPTFTPPSVPNGPGNFTSGQAVMRVADNGDAAYSVATPGIGGGVTTQYSLLLAMERLI